MGTDFPYKLSNHFVLLAKTFSFIFVCSFFCRFLVLSQILGLSSLVGTLYCACICDSTEMTGSLCRWISFSVNLSSHLNVRNVIGKC